MSGYRRPRLAIAARLLVAIVGGYGVASLLSMLVARTLPLSGVEASMTAMMIAFLAYAGIIMAVLHARAVRRALGALTATAAITGVMLLMVGPKVIVP
ncbi:DUF3649 domain-containing protein [Sphingomonas crocodyli]|uniref:DUF3649 domain-containing protein n=1 Tax=Sphingomonas crocodyli TaxID=1979270 RepID=A0A437LZV2_9SPHN|nr:DUF3649 domain-containing protein [Sphingomonas crocodyli]RVT90937.1 DUF3649 domain-containing protein [Sphingomonas crocodyli]